MNSTIEVSSSQAPTKWEPGFKLVSKPNTFAVSDVSIVAQLIGFTDSYWPQDKKQQLDADLAREGNGLRSLLNTLQDATGIDICQLDPTLLLRRLAWRMRLNGVDDLATYETVLAHNPAELPALRRSLLIRVTDFFRDPNVYFELERAVLPALLKAPGSRLGDDAGMRILVTGCGTGEEAYSLAMLVEAMMKRNRHRVPVRILGNDEDKNALNQARRGYYPHLVTADLSPFCLDHFFEATRDGYRINEKIRSHVRFVHNETDDATTFSDLDLLVCRNPLLFRNSDIQHKLIQAFYSRLRPGGYLMLEPTVRSEKLSTLFEELDVQHGLYRRRDTAVATRKPAASPAMPAPSDVATPQVMPLTRYLEEELFETKERLRLTIEEYETAHDELVDQNHKLQTGLRQALLEKDQIQAEHAALKDMEDGILRANKDLKNQSTQLQNAYAHLEGIIAHSGIGFVLLNENGGVEMFTPGAGSLLNLTRSDIGRPISSVASPFHWDFPKAVASVARSQTAIERKAYSTNDRWYKIRVQPYSFGEQDKGLVCTFVDVTDQHRAGEWDRFKADVLNQMKDAVVITNQNLQVTYLNKAAIERYNLFNKKAMGCRLEDLYTSVWKNEAEREKAYRVLAEKGHWTGTHYLLQLNGTESRVESSIHVLRDQADDEMGMLMVVRDIQHREEEDTGALRRLISDLEKRNEAIDEKLRQQSTTLQEADK
ncbi:MAG: CheR family methyltransferase [Bacteroidota bacterium]